MSGSTWTWISTASTAWAQSSNWSLNGTASVGFPQPGDTALLPGGTTAPVGISGTQLTNNTIDMSGGAVVDFANGSTVDAGSTLNDISGAATISTSGVFTDFGNLEVIQPGAVLTINLNGGTLVSNGNTGDIGLNVGTQGVANSGTMFVIGGTLSNQEVHVNDGTADVTSALQNNDLLSVDDGILEIDQPTTVSPQSISFVSGGTSTVKFGVPGNFNGDGNGNISGFAANDTIDIGANIIGTIVYSGDLGGYANFTAENSSGTPIFSAILSGGDESSFQGGTFTVGATGGTAGSFHVTQGSGDTLITESGTLSAGPSITAGANVSYTASAAPKVLDSGLTVTDTEASTLTNATVAIAAGFLSGDTLAVGSPQVGITSIYNPATGTLTLVGTATLAAYQSELDSVTYVSTASDPTSGGTDNSRTIQWVANDGTTTGNANSSVTVIGPAPAGPAITAGASVSYTAGGAATTLDSGLSITDGESSTIAAARVVISGGFLAGDTLAVGSPQGGISSSYNASTGTLTLSGSASLSAYQAELDSVTYSSSSSNPTSGGTDTSRTIGWMVNDGTTIASANSSVTVSGTVSTTGSGPTSTGTVVVGSSNYIQGDFNGAGLSDILFYNATTGDTGYWAPPATAGGAGTFTDLVDASTSYNIAGIGNFTGGPDAEILYRNNTSGDFGYYQPTATGAPGAWHDLGTSSTAYNVIGTGNFTGDGSSSVMFENETSGAVGILSLTSSNQQVFQNDGTVSPQYTASGVGSFTGNGQVEMLFLNPTTGDFGYYTPSASGGQGTWFDFGFASTSYSVVGVGFLTSSTVSDIVLRNNTTGDFGYYAPSAGGGVGTWHDIGLSSTAYTAVQVGDFTGNGLTDIAFRNNTTGDFGYWAPTTSGSAGAWHDIGSSATTYTIAASPNYA